MPQGQNAAALAARWPPPASKLSLLGIAYGPGSLRICTGALLELMHLQRDQLTAVLASATVALQRPAHISQVCREPFGAPLYPFIVISKACLRGAILHEV